MISANENLTALINLGDTIRAIKNLDKAIEVYTVQKAGPVYLNFAGTTTIQRDVSYQFDRDIMVDCLKAQKAKLVAYLADLGIDWDVQNGA